MVPGLRNSFGIFMTRASMFIHCHYLRFNGDTIKELFDVVTESCANVMWELLCILEENHVVECKIFNIFVFPIRGNIR